ncbi:hypothetical protein AHAS_Ahas05G0108300 [Arachis hypogaea]
MPDPLVDLEQALHLKRVPLSLYPVLALVVKNEKLTAEEANFLVSYRYKALNEFATAFAGGAATWAATWKLWKPFRVYLSAGAGAFSGMWMFWRSWYSSIDQILSMDGSILQKELANILLTKYPTDTYPLLKPIMSKHFYVERIFDDSTPNTAKLRWRYRNFYSDNAVHGHRAHDNDSNAKTEGDSPNGSHNDSRGDSKTVNGSKSPNLEARRIFILQAKAVLDTMTELDPLDSLFDDGSPQEEIHHPNSPDKPSGTHNRSHRRSRRRRRMRNHEDLSKMD